MSSHGLMKSVSMSKVHNLVNCNICSYRFDFFSLCQFSLFLYNKFCSDLNIDISPQRVAMLTKLMLKLSVTYYLYASKSLELLLHVTSSILLGTL